MELPQEMKKRPSTVPQIPIQDEMNAQESEIEFAKKILGMLALTQSEELTCDEVFAFGQATFGYLWGLPGGIYCLEKIMANMQ